MIGYVTLGTNDLARAARFYDAIAKELGVGRMALSEIPNNFGGDCR
jgi:catechol 2,3-dioxygenase-like lactoylglutathione lyase family enzyme